MNLAQNVDGTGRLKVRHIHRNKYKLTADLVTDGLGFGGKIYTIDLPTNYENRHITSMLHDYNRGDRTFTFIRKEYDN